MLGEGIIQGLVETARNFFGSYVEKDRLTTVQYPEERLPLPEASRVFPFLLYDGTDPEAGLRASLALHRLAERVEASHVAAARSQGWSWQQIGDALGVTRQSVHAKHGKEL